VSTAQDLVRASLGAQARGEVHRLADHVVDARAEVARAGEHEAGLDAGMQEHGPVRARAAQRDAARTFMQEQRRSDRAPGVVFVTLAHAEQRDDLVSNELVDDAAARLDDAARCLFELLEHAGDVFRVFVADERRVPAHVDEQDRRHAPLIERPHAPEGYKVTRLRRKSAGRGG
jgi:hypothetical protein